VYYRMTRLHWDEERFDDLVEWAATVRNRIESLDGLLFADLVRTGAGQGMVMAGSRAKVISTLRATPSTKSSRQCQSF
jgi:hypothetical protein